MLQTDEECSITLIAPEGHYQPQALHDDGSSTTLTLTNPLRMCNYGKTVTTKLIVKYSMCAHDLI